MDDESAEIELLEQNLNKTRQISHRMTSRLEKSILPLYTSTQILNRRANNIEKALLKIDEVASSHEGIEAEFSLISRGPQPGQLSVYTDVVERLNASIAFKQSDQDTLQTAHLVETGAKKLTQLYTKLVAEASTGVSPPPGTDVTANLFPEDILSSLNPLVRFLRTLPLPATHPSHPAAKTIMSTLKEAQKGYAEMRGAWARKCLESEAKRVLDRADTIDSLNAGKEFGYWVQSLLSVAEEEYGYLVDLAPLTAPALIASAYNTLLNPVLVLFSTTVTSLIAFIKRSLHKHTFLALSSYESLAALQTRWDRLLSRRGAEKRKDSNELKDGLHALRAVCLRSFPEFLADLRMASMGKGANMSTGLADFTTSVVQYMDRLPEVQAAVGTALVTLGDGNWKMGDGLKVTGGKSGEGDEQVLLQHYIFDVVMTTVKSLTELSKTHSRPALGAIFLLNNISYLRQNIILEPRHESLRDLLSPPTTNMLDSNFRTAKAGYFDANFSPLMQALADDPKEKGKTAAKEKFTRFFDLLEEVLERHKYARVLEDDPTARESIGEDVIKLVVPALQKFTNKQREKEFSKNPQKYIKMSPDAVEKQLKSLYFG
ncbi:Cullin repeat-like-containing domain protein [Schizophyllum commune]|nr:hypothetical protein K525DRAFT_193141 [Schizophyllum commune Loenen D]